MKKVGLKLNSHAGGSQRFYGLWSSHRPPASMGVTLPSKALKLKESCFEKKNQSKKMSFNPQAVGI